MYYNIIDKKIKAHIDDVMRGVDLGDNITYGYGTESDRYGEYYYVILYYKDEYFEDEYMILVGHLTYGGDVTLLDDWKSDLPNLEEWYDYIVNFNYEVYMEEKENGEDVTCWEKYLPIFGKEVLSRVEENYPTGGTTETHKSVEVE